MLYILYATSNRNMALIYTNNFQYSLDLFNNKILLNFCIPQSLSHPNSESADFLFVTFLGAVDPSDILNKESKTQELQASKIEGRQLLWQT